MTATHDRSYEQLRPPLSARAVKAAWAAFTGFTLDSFDIYLPVVALAPAMAFFIPRTLSTGTQALIASYVFVSTLIGRPIGA